VTAWAAMDSASSPSGMTPPKVPRQRKRLMYLVANRKAWVNRICQRSSVRTGRECGWLPCPGNEHKVNQIQEHPSPKSQPTSRQDPRAKIQRRSKRQQGWSADLMI